MPVQRQGSNQCRVWNCNETIRKQYEFCREHYYDSIVGLIDDCPGCGRAKDSDYDTCTDCRSTATTRTPKRYQREHSKAWEAGDSEATEFFVYILKLEGGSFYAGQTRELRERLMEHRDGKTKTTAGKNPKLVWFTQVETREQAADYEVVLKKICDTNPREIRRRVLDLKDLVGELDYT